MGFTNTTVFERFYHIQKEEEAETIICDQLGKVHAVRQIIFTFFFNFHASFISIRQIIFTFFFQFSYFIHKYRMEYVFTCFG